MVATGRWRFYWREERPEESERLKLREGRFALLRGVRTQGPALAALRRLLARHPAGSLWRLTDDAVLKLLEQRLSDGRILLYEWVPERGGGSSEPEVAIGPAFPLEERRVSAPAPPPPDPAVFPDDAELAAIADGLKKASESGVPFCEECQKAAAARQGSGQ